MNDFSMSMFKKVIQLRSRGWRVKIVACVVTHCCTFSEKVFKQSFAYDIITDLFSKTTPLVVYLCTKL